MTNNLLKNNAPYRQYPTIANISKYTQHTLSQGITTAIIAT